MLTGFFDGTASDRAPKVSGVAGVLYDDDGSKMFREGWAALRAEFKHEYGYDVPYFHAADCCGKYAYEDFQGWLPEHRWRLCHEMAALVGRTRLAEFVSTCDEADYKAILASNPEIAKDIGGHYSATAMVCLEEAGKFANKRCERVLYVFEHGDPCQNELERFLITVRNTPRLRQHYAFDNYMIIPKSDLSPEWKPLMAADILAWECRRNFSEILKAERNGTDAGTWTPNFLPVRGEYETYFERHLGRGGLEVQAIINAANGLTKKGNI